MQTDHPKTLVLADQFSGGRVAELIRDRAAKRATYQSIADELRNEFDLDVSRDMVRRWVAADLAEAAS